MRHATVTACAVLALSLAAPAARACAPADLGCPPRTLVFPSYTPEGERIRTAEAPVRPTRHPEVSRFTGQPLAGLFNNPGSVPGSVDRDLALVPLPRVKPFKTQAVYPRGY